LAAAAKGRAHIGTFAVLKKDDNDHKETDN
jgi:hypothetical protein